MNIILMRALAIFLHFVKLKWHEINLNVMETIDAKSVRPEYFQVMV